MGGSDQAADTIYAIIISSVTVTVLPLKGDLFDTSLLMQVLVGSAGLEFPNKEWVKWHLRFPTCGQSLIYLS